MPKRIVRNKGSIKRNEIIKNKIQHRRSQENLMMKKQIKKEKSQDIRKKMLILLVIGILLIASISSVIFAMGLLLTIFSILMLIEILEKVETTKSYTYFFYYSYYSFTLYLLHNPLALLFTQQFNYITVWLVIIVGLVIMGLILRPTYKKIGKWASLKAVLSILSFLISTRLIEKRSKKSS